MSKSYKYECMKCGKVRTSVKKDQIVCQKCLKWTEPGLGQLKIGQ